MTPERREQVEKEVREKWWIETEHLVSQTIALAEAQERIAELTKALRKIANPVLAMRVEAEAEGLKLSGSYAIALSEDHNYLKEIARAALKGE